MMVHLNFLNAYFTEFYHPVKPVMGTIKQEWIFYIPVRGKIEYNPGRNLWEK